MTITVEEIRKCRVLVVEDSDRVRQLIGAYLTAAGLTNIAYAVDGEDGLAKVESFDPDLVILDIMMPKMDGFELCRRLRADEKHRRLPILVQTALESPDERTSVFRVGATDLVTKPIHGPELISRVMVQLENRVLIRSLEAYRERLHGELELAREMQQGLLPTRAQIEGLAHYGITLDSHFEPSSELGGDFWGVRDLGDGRVGICVVDFTGHGVRAALNTFRMHTLMRQMPPDPENLAGHVAALNDRLCELLPLGQFATFLYAIVDIRLGTLTYASAGAPNPVVGTPAGLQVLDGTGMPLGISHLGSYQAHTIAFPPGSFLFLYSDALIETPDADGKGLEDDQVAALAVEASLREHPIEHLLSRFREGREVPSDDLTAVMLRRF